MEEWEHPLSPNLGGPASGAAVPAVDYFDWYFPRLYAGVEHDLTQSGFQHPWDWSALAGGTLPDDICAQFGEPLDANVWVADREGVAPERVVVGHGVTQCLTLALLAEQAQLSRFQLVRAFSRLTGLTPHAYLLQRRLLKARQLVAAGLPLAEAAATAGFADQSHMSRHFVRCFGFTPGLYARPGR